MPSSPKTIFDRMEKMINAWRTLAPDKSFGGMTLAQFEAAAEPSRAARRKIEEIDAQRADAVIERDTADEAFDAKVKFVVAGVRADPTEGPDSALYESFGYTRDSERKSGLTRKGTKQTPTA